ncbi:MAG: biosynthetic-type acetolactate synthase large subunit [Abditibacteriota bacterium]|nr:biosynthetic-type acetolactate synthase large subunit [Abditibacteriota bacterium]
MKLKGSEALVQSLVDCGVEVIFGIPGGQMIPIYDALYGRTDIKNILMRHEQGAAHAADGYARATGKIGVCFATSGPGATNLVTGIATANMDSIPMLAVTGQVGTAALGKDAFQEVDITGVTMPITKHSYLVKKAEDLPRVVSEAIYIATTGRPGPVLIDIPSDVQRAVIDYKPVKSVSIRSYIPIREATGDAEIEKAAKMINASKKPVIYAGGGVVSAGASKELTEFAEKANIYAAATLMGKGAISDKHPKCLGMPGMHGTVAANYAFRDCDLMIVCGARFDDRITGKIYEFAKNAKIIHIDIDKAEQGKTIKPDLSVVSDCKTALKKLIPLVNAKPEGRWNKQLAAWKKEYAMKVPAEKDKLLPQYILAKLSEITKGNAIVVTDVGQHQMFSALYTQSIKPRTFLSSGGFGTMGFGFPAAFGAQVGEPKADVFAVVGDGGFQMTLQELAPAVEQKLPVKILIFNNKYLGMVRQWQELFWNKHYSGVDISAQPDFVKLAESYGACGIMVDKPADVEKALKKSLAIKDKPVVIDFRIDPEENVYPMIPAGMSVDDMLISKEDK